MKSDTFPQTIEPMMQGFSVPPSVSPVSDRLNRSWRRRSAAFPKVIDPIPLRGFPQNLPVPRQVNVTQGSLEQPLRRKQRVGYGWIHGC
jgi:hypothetical protein